MAERRRPRRRLFSRRDAAPDADANGSAADEADISPSPGQMVPPPPPVYVPSIGRAEPGTTEFRGPLESVLRHPLLALIPILLLTGGGIALGLSRATTYKAEARVSVGRVDVPAYTLQGVVIGNQTLAAGYARAIAANRVATLAGAAVGIPAPEAAARLSASPIPESTLIRIEAKETSRDTAVRLANAGAGALISYVAGLNRSQQSTGLLDQYRTAQARTDTRRTRLTKLLRATLPDARAIAAARLSLATAQLASQTLSAQYQNSAGAPSSQNNLQLIVPASSAKSDRVSSLERLGLVGLVAGLVVGIALALLRANRGLLGRRER